MLDQRFQAVLPSLQMSYAVHGIPPLVLCELTRCPKVLLLAVIMAKYPVGATWQNSGPAIDYGELSFCLDFLPTSSLRKKNFYLFRLIAA